MRRSLHQQAMEWIRAMKRVNPSQDEVSKTVNWREKQQRGTTQRTRQHRPHNSKLPQAPMIQQMRSVLVIDDTESEMECHKSMEVDIQLSESCGAASDDGSQQSRLPISQDIIPESLTQQQQQQQRQDVEEHNNPDSNNNNRQ